MPDTGAPWNIPYADPTDLVRDWPALSEDVAEAVADGLDAAGGLVAVKFAIKTNTQVSAGITTGARVAISGLQIVHTLSDAANKLIFMAHIGYGNETGSQRGSIGLAVVDGGTPIVVGDAEGTRTRVTAGGYGYNTSSQERGNSLAASIVYEPGDTNSHTYDLHVYNITTATSTLYVNRNQGDGLGSGSPRSASSLIMMEVKV